jgi:hypothetical protein
MSPLLIALLAAQPVCAAAPTAAGNAPAAVLSARWRPKAARRSACCPIRPCRRAGGRSLAATS